MLTKVLSKRLLRRLLDTRLPEQTAGMALYSPSSMSMASLGASSAAVASPKGAAARSASPLSLPRSSRGFPIPSSHLRLCSSPAILARLRVRQIPHGGVGVVRRSAGAAAYATSFVSDPGQLKSAREDIKELLRNKFCHPIMIRLGWHDSGTYDKNIEEWPKRGGADGSLRFEAELKHAANAGKSSSFICFCSKLPMYFVVQEVHSLINALNLLQPIKDKYHDITYADLFQLASATAVEEAGGPKIPMKYGRVDVTEPEQCPEEGRLPDAGPPSPADHLRNVFYRMGLNDQEIVALSGAHTLGRSRPERSGWGKPETKYTDIKERKEEDLLVLPTDAVLFEDPSFKVYAEKYAEDQDAFFKDYAEAHAKLSNLGAKFDPPEGFSIDNDSENVQPEKFAETKVSLAMNFVYLSVSARMA
ncbi:hypothetical protein Taro_017403 [Colocasia esculenta]|uniref:L-ascorbate peroxidase n=1 Tax=Colocasia esculenta TaxID=4460 RepID=A0A843UR97_COLES|nr:hypothetical protein [Colocasia esculenta]